MLFLLTPVAGYCLIQSLKVYVWVLNYIINFHFSFTIFFHTKYCQHFILKTFSTTKNIFVLFLVDGRWSLWQEWSTCGGLVNCTSGYLYKRIRTCSNPEPAGDGASCLGIDYQQASLGNCSVKSIILCLFESIIYIYLNI